jgi:hypothetical protein
MRPGISSNMTSTDLQLLKIPFLKSTIVKYYKPSTSTHVFGEVGG